MEQQVRLDLLVQRVQLLQSQVLRGLQVQPARLRVLLVQQVQQVLMELSVLTERQDLQVLQVRLVQQVQLRQ